MKPFTPTLLSLFVLTASAQAQEYYFQEEWTNPPSPDDWHIQTESPPETLIENTTTIVHSGSHALKAQLSNPDKLYKRAEVSHQHKAAMQNQYFYRYSMFLPEVGYPQNNNDGTTFTIISQWHATPDFHLGETWRQPPLALSVNEAGELKVRTVHCDLEVNDNSQSTGFNHLNENGGNSFPLPKGEWVDIEVSVCWDWDEDGFLDIWMNGEKIVNYSGPTCYNDVNGPYMKLGIYRTPWITETETIYYDDLQILRNGVIVHPDMDTFTRGGAYSDQNHGSATSILVKHSNNVDYLRRGYLHFDLSEFTAYDFTKADLKLALGATSSSSLYVIRVSTNWTENGLIFDSALNLASSDAPATVTPSQAEVLLPVEYRPYDTGISFELYLDVNVNNEMITVKSRENSIVTDYPALLVKFF